jgi:HD-GYP domain-containing protein (c-di-GMP phosphodiesterase class II)
LKHGAPAPRGAARRAVAARRHGHGARPRPGGADGAPGHGARGCPGLDRVCRAFGEAVDLKTPLHHGHATGVAELAAAAAERAGLAAPAIVELRRAALLHDIGRAAIPNGVCERPGPLTWADQERVRLHAYHSERVLARSGPLAGLATVVGLHHERLDGSGYHRQASAAVIGLPGRILAAADAFEAMTQARAHRPARSREEAGDVLAAEARGGHLDPDAVRAVLDAAGQHPSAIRRARPRASPSARSRSCASSRRGFRTRRSPSAS